jgi:hypothetical protein
MPTRNHLGAERIVRPEVPRVHAAINITSFSADRAIALNHSTVTLAEPVWASGHDLRHGPAQRAHRRDRGWITKVHSQPSSS